MTRNKTLLIAAGLGVVLASLSLYTVSETEFALITQFGRPVRLSITHKLSTEKEPELDVS